MRLLASIGLLAFSLVTQARADIFTTGYFSGDIYRVNEQTAQRSVFASVGAFTGLAGIAYNPFNNQIYVSVQNLERVYAYNADTGANVGMFDVGYAPAGLSVAANGKVYVARFGNDPPTGMQPPPTTAEIYVYDPTFVAAPQVVTIPLLPVGTAGVGVATNGDAYISTNGAGLYNLPSGSSIPVSFAGTVPESFSAIGQVAVGQDGRVYAGSGVGVTNDVAILNANGTYFGPITIAESLVNTTGMTGGSSAGTSPGGVAVDANGDIIVAVLGRNNPFEAQGQNGGLFKFSPNGGSVPIQTFATDFFALSAVTIGPTAVPEPASIGFLLVVSAGAVAYKQRRKRRTIGGIVSSL